MARIEISAVRVGELAEMAILIDGIDDAPTVRAICEMVREVVNRGLPAQVSLVTLGTPEEDQIRREVQELLLKGTIDRTDSLSVLGSGKQ